AGVKVAIPASIERSDETAECEDRKNRERNVASHEPRVIGEKRIERETRRERDRLDLVKALPKEEGRKREHASEDDDDQSHREIRGSEHREHHPIHLLEERSVDDGLVFEGSRPK